MHGHRKRVCTESWLWEKNPMPHLGVEPASAACRSDAVPTELHPHPTMIERYLVFTVLSVWRVVAEWTWYKSIENDIRHGSSYLGDVFTSSIENSGMSDSGELRTLKLKVPPGENTELKRSPFKAWSRSVYSHTGYAYCLGFLPCLFPPFWSIYLHFFQVPPDFSCVGCG